MGLCFHRALWLYCIVEKHKKVSNGAVLVNIHHPVHKWPKMHHLSILLHVLVVCG